MEEKILKLLINIQSDICDMKKDIQELKEDVKELKIRMTRLEERMDRLENRVENLEKKVNFTDAKHDRNYEEIKMQRQIDSNNIAKILNIQTSMKIKLEKIYA